MDGTVTHATATGRRGAQEDRCAVVRLETGWALAVIDGHGGSGAAQAAADAFEDAIRNSLERGGGGEATVRDTIAALYHVTADFTDGASATVACVDEGAGRLAVAVLGDSPAIVREASGQMVIGPIHNTFFAPEDAAAAQARGAVRVGPYLCDERTGEGVNLTRTIGDAKLTFLGRDPDTFSAELGPGSFVLVASDGIFTASASTPDALAERMGRLVGGGGDAGLVVYDALACESDDNVTAVVWRAP